VQAAIVQFSDLGRILAQQTQISDLQQRLDELTRQIRRAKGDKARIAALRRERTQINRRAAYATVDLALTTHEPEQKVAPPSRLDRAVDDASGVLTTELAIAAYLLIVASPFLVLLAAALAGNRAYRRYSDQRLLERA
jgi:cell division septum initiation protein DivIVA